MANILDGLNQHQREAVVHFGTPLLLLAGAGSGKTRVLTHRAAWFVKEGLAAPDQILLLTFTNKAADEMKQRMGALLNLPAKELSSRDTPSMFAGTFHSFCCRILRADGVAVGVPQNYVIYDSGDQENIVKSILKDMDLNPKEFKANSVIYFIENCKNHYQTPKEAKDLSHGFWAETAANIYSRYQKKLDEFGALDFNDLLFKAVELLQQNPKVLEKYQHRYRFILVDEYQDTNQIQYLLTKMLAKKYLQITAVGDAAQAIYGWRGANYQNLVSFTADFNRAKVINLEQNYRSTTIILDAANAVISKNSSHPVLKLYSTKKSTQKITTYEARSEIDESEYVASKIKYIHDNLHISYKDMAVLYRMNTQSRVLEEAFLKANIPYVLIGGLKFYERAEIKDIIAMLRVVANPRDKVSEERVEKALGKRRKSAFDTHIKSFDYHHLSSLQVLESVVVNSGYLDKFDPKVEEDQHRIENIKELKSVAASNATLEEFLENITLVQQEYSLQEKKKKKENREGVRLMTLHSSKGLEFEVVFLVGFEEGILPHSRCFVDPSEVEEERRLCYVGITRAKEILYITFASQRLYFGKSSLNEPSRFLADIPTDLIEHDQVLNEIRDYRNPHSADDELVYDPDIY